MAVHAAGESGPARPGTYAVVLASDALADVSARLSAAGITHHLVRESEDAKSAYAGQLLAIGIPPQPRERIRRVLSSIRLFA